MNTSTHKTGPKSKFTEQDDEKLKSLVSVLGMNAWKEIASNFRNKTAKQCKNRWNNYINPSLKHDSWTEIEDQIIIEKFLELGSRWTKIQTYLPNRSPNDIRYRWLKITKDGDDEGSEPANRRTSGLNSVGEIKSNWLQIALN